jgi:DNA-binding NtrC family response regulator
VGSNQAYPVDIRILAATNRDLAKEVADNNFREDLFYRLNVVVVEVPPLRDRKEDLALLAKYFLERFATDLAPTKEIARQTYLYLENYDWPGNIRELENVIRRTIALGRTELIEPKDLPANIFAPAGDGPAPVETPSGDSMASYEKSAIINALKKSGFNRRTAAQMLGIGEATLYRKISKYGLAAKTETRDQDAS